MCKQTLFWRKQVKEPIYLARIRKIKRREWWELTQKCQSGTDDRDYRRQRRRAIVGYKRQVIVLALMDMDD